MDTSVKYNLLLPSSDDKLPDGIVSAGGEEAARLREQVKRGDFSGLRSYLARTRETHEWEDRIFMLDAVVPSVSLPHLEFVFEAEKSSADLFLLRCFFFSHVAEVQRGHGTCDQVPEGRFRDAAACVEEARLALELAARFDAEDPTGHARILKPCLIFSHLQPAFTRAFQKSTELAPGLVPAHFTMTNALSKRWYGSHERCLDFARTALAKATPGSDMAACLFRAHSLVQGHLKFFDKNPKAADKYLRDPEVVAELTAAFDVWAAPGYLSRRSSAAYFHFAARWFYQLRDQDRLRRALELTDRTFSSDPWEDAGNAVAIFTAALHFARHSQLEDGPADLCETCFQAVRLGADSISVGKLAQAESALMLAQVAARKVADAGANYLLPLAQFHWAWMLQEQGHEERAKRVREEAAAALDEGEFESRPEPFQRLMAHVLFEIGDYRRAIPFWERVAQLSREEAVPARLAAILHKLGDCYNRAGLRDHAVVPLRAALKLLQPFPSDPKYPALLLSLGNALRTRFPSEAEACYRQTADWYVARQQYDSATPAWANLGLVCSQQGRNVEALEHYERVLHLRERWSKKNPGSIASVLNNIANAYRRMGKFREAHASIDRAIKLLPARDRLLASTYGTRGQIYMESGDDKRAVEWLRKSYDERMRQPSPNLEEAEEDLEKEIAALERLGQKAKVAERQAALQTIRAKLKSAPQSDAEISSGKATMDGAVFIELVFGAGYDQARWRKDTRLLAGRLSRHIREHEAGYFSSAVAVAESTTLVFYGPDGEELFRFLEPLMATEPACAGAKVAIWQKGSQREVVLPGSRSRVN